jgi:hypothetical protein
LLNLKVQLFTFNTVAYLYSKRNPNDAELTVWGIDKQQGRIKKQLKVKRGVVFFNLAFVLGYRSSLVSAQRVCAAPLGCWPVSDFYTTVCPDTKK